MVFAERIGALGDFHQRKQAIQVAFVVLNRSSGDEPHDTTIQFRGAYVFFCVVVSHVVRLVEYRASPLDI